MLFIDLHDLLWEKGLNKLTKDQAGDILVVGLLMCEELCKVQNVKS